MKTEKRRKTNSWKFHIMSQDTGPNSTHYRWFKCFKVYIAYKEYVYERVRKFDFEESFAGQFLKAGFTCSNPNLNPTINWFGVSVYHPDVIFVKEDVVIVMSLQGLLTKYNCKYHELFKSMSIRYIEITKSGEVLYQDWTGNLPQKELIYGLCGK